jgi:xanthine dehydrogenase accessory factor
MNKGKIILIRGGGDIASGVALRLHRAGMRVVITELYQPLVIRRSVSFAEAVYTNIIQVEEVEACLVDTIGLLESTWNEGVIPVLIDPECHIIPDLLIAHLDVFALVDARMTKNPPYLNIGSAPFMIGLGPGFVVGENCDAIVETNRGHYLGRVIWEGSALSNTGVPEGFGDQYRDRVLRSPGEGVFRSEREICERLDPGDLIGEVNGLEIRAAFKGVLRGLLHSGIHVSEGFKIGDLDPRDDPAYCRFVSDKSLAIAGGVLEAILSIKSQGLELKK